MTRVITIKITATDALAKLQIEKEINESKDVSLFLLRAMVLGTTFPTLKQLCEEDTESSESSVAEKKGLK